uniref:Tc1-like transposase DDE domain-containing protein n=1 Tax=Amphiprion percula TaxID=161767 RepID=A0A3P8SGA8_AMPPE
MGVLESVLPRGVLRYLEQQRDQQVTGWLVHLQAACMGHLARQKYRKLKVQQMAVRCLQRNLRALRFVTKWSWWKLFCRVRPLLDVNMDNERLRAKEVDTQLCSGAEKSEKERNELRQTADSLETKVTAVTSELSDERFRGDAVGSGFDVERAERLRLSRDNKDLQVVTSSLHVTQKASWPCSWSAAQTEVNFVRRRLKQTEEKLETERQTRQQWATLQAQLEQSRRSVTELKRHCRRVTSDLQDARVLTDSLQSRMHEVDRKQRRSVSPHTIHMRFEMEMERMKQIHQKELEDKEEELEDVHKSSQRRLRQLEMQLEQEYDEKQMVIHEKHDLEGLIATLCDQVGHRDFDVEKKLRRDLKRTHALLADTQLLLATIDSSGQNLPNGSKEQIERLHCQVLSPVQTPLYPHTSAMSPSIELENICKQKSMVDEQLALLQHEKVDLLKRLEEDQEDLNELMKKHKALIAQSSSDISQIRELQAELEEVKKQRHSLQEELQQSVSRVQFLESSTVGRSIVSKQEARVCDLENKLEFHRGQVKRFEVLVLRLRDSVVRLGEELEQSAQAEAREKENARYYQQRLQDMRLEMDELTQREQDSSRRRMELVMHSNNCCMQLHRAGLGSLVPVKGTLNASAYQDILDNSILPTLWEQFGAGPFLFQHDCAPVHKARSIKTWMTESGVDELDWPAQSPDLNPIEHLWDELERRLRARPSGPTSVCDLTNALLEEWSKIPINTLLNLVDSLPRRVEAVIAAKGGPKSY